MFLLDHLPSDSLDVLLSLDVRHLCIDITSEEKNLQAGLLEILEESDGACVLFEGGADLVAAGFPEHVGHVKLLLDILIVEEERNAVLVGAAAWLSIDLVVQFLIECTVPEPSPRFGVISRWRIANTDAIVRVDSLSGLHNPMLT